MHCGLSGNVQVSLSPVDRHGFCYDTKKQQMKPDAATVLALAGSCLFVAFEKLADAASRAAVCTASVIQS